MSSEEIADMLNWHTVRVEPYLGESSNGSVFGPPQTVTGTVVERIETVLGAGGQDTISTATISTLPEMLGVFVSQSIVILPSGRLTRVVSCEVSLGGTGPIQGMDNIVVHVS
jgi:hypothetical protein